MAPRPPRRAPGWTRRGVSGVASGHRRIPQSVHRHLGPDFPLVQTQITLQKKMLRIFPTPCPVTCPLDQVTSRLLPRTNPCKQVHSRDGSLGKCNKSGQMQKPQKWPSRIFRNLPNKCGEGKSRARLKGPRWTEQRLQYILFRVHYITPPVTSRGIPELLNHCGLRGWEEGRGWRAEGAGPAPAPP